MKCRIILSFLLLAAFGLAAQTSGLYIPSDKPLRPKELEQAFVNPEVFCMLLHFDGQDSTYREADLNLLDSAYRIAFGKESPKLYTMSVEAYGDAGNERLMESRIESVCRYFTLRGHEKVPVRYAYNPIHCNCNGDTVELVRFEVPLDKQVYDCAQLPDSRKILNKAIPLEGTVLVTFRNNPVECIGDNNGCYIPQQDSNIRSYYTQVFLPKGCVYAVRNTKAECPPPLEISIEEHLDPVQMVEKYVLVPHRKNIILPIGYIVLRSNYAKKVGDCKIKQPDSIFVRFPVTQEQIDSKLRVFAKGMGSRGIEYRSLPTRKVKGGAVLMIQAAINPTQFDTLYLAKRVKMEELGDYLYEVDSPSEQGAVTIMEGKEEHFFKAFRINRKGEYEYKSSFRDMLRIVEDEEETPSTSVEKSFQNDGDEDIE